MLRMLHPTDVGGKDSFPSFICQKNCWLIQIGKVIIGKDCSKHVQLDQIA